MEAPGFEFRIQVLESCLLLVFLLAFILGLVLASLMKARLKRGSR